MKTIIFFFLLTVQYFAQVQGCEYTGKVDSLITIPTTINCRGASQYAILTVNMLNTGDSILVFIGTTMKDSTAVQQEYGQVAVIDMSTGGLVPVITGNVSTNRKYKIDTYKGKNIQLKGNTNTGDTPYIVEFY